MDNTQKKIKAKNVANMAQRFGNGYPKLLSEAAATIIAFASTVG